MEKNDMEEIFKKVAGNMGYDLSKANVTYTDIHTLELHLGFLIFREHVHLIDKWISVDDRLPESGQNVIYYFKPVGMFIGKYEKINDPDYGAGDCFYSERGFLTNDVTHWMPLPEPPENGKK